MKKAKAVLKGKDKDSDGVTYLTYEYKGYEYTITDQTDEYESMADKHAWEQERIDAMLLKLKRTAERREDTYDAEEIFRRLGWA